MNLHRIVINRAAGIPVGQLAVLLVFIPLLAMGVASQARAVTYYATYELNGGTATKSNQTYSASATDTSGVWATNSGGLTLNSCTISTTGNSSDVNSSSQYGLNAGVLATAAGKITIAGGSVTTSGSGANGLFATGSGSSISMSNGTITATGGNAHGVDVTYTGSITLNNVNVSTSGASSSALATDFGGGTVNVTGGTITASSTASGSHSAGIYSTGTISVTGATVSSLGDCGGVIDGANAIYLTNTALSGTVEGIKTWKTAPASGTATVTINGGSLTASAGDAFYVTGTTGNAATGTITVKGGAAITASTGKILNVDSSSTATFAADGETLTGNLIADSTSSITAKLQNSTTLTGVVNRAAMTIDSTSVWYGIAGSVLTSLSNSGKVSSKTNSPGLLTISGAYTQASTGTLNIELGGTTAGSTYDKISVTGAATLAGTLNLDLVNDFIPTVGQTFNILTYGSKSGTFSSITYSDQGLTCSVAYNSPYAQLTVTAVSIFDWKGGDSSGTINWNIASNWNPGTGVPDGAGVQVRFGNQASANNVVDMISAGRTIGGADFYSTTSTTIQSTGGYSLTLDNGSNISTIAVAGSHTISAPVILNSDASITGVGTLNLSGGVTGNHGLSISGNVISEHSGECSYNRQRRNSYHSSYSRRANGIKREPYIRSRTIHSRPPGHRCNQPASLHLATAKVECKQRSKTVALIGA